MSYKLNKPYTEKQKNDFIVQYNHKQGLAIKETSKALYALQPWEVLEGDEVIDNTEEYEAKKAQEEKERIGNLFLTGADVERGIYQAKGMDFEDIVAYVTQLQPEGLDIKALKIELKANNFYRGNPYVVAIGELLGFTEEQLDLFFKDGNYEHLLPKEKPVDPQENQATSEIEPTDDPSLTQEELNIENLEEV